MKKYLVIKRYKSLSSVVEASFDVKEDAFQYARLCEVRDDNKYEYIVAEVLQCKREKSTKQVLSPLFSCLFFACGNIKNTSKLLAEEEEKDVDVWMLGTVSTRIHLYILYLSQLSFFLNIQLFSYYLRKRILFTINYI